MSPHMAAQVEYYEAIKPDRLDIIVAGMERSLAQYQQQLAAARKAQKNQKRAAKKDGRSNPVSP